MKRLATVALAAALIGLAQPAAAQDAGAIAGLLSTVGEGVGQSLGQAIVGGESIFVYARGSAKLPAPQPGAYSVQVTTSAPTAVVAAGQRDAEIDALRAVAVRFSAPFAVTGETLSLGDASGGGGFHLPLGLSTPSGAATSQDGTAAAKPNFDAKATVLLGEPASGKDAEFLDALHQAGADSIASGDGQSLFNRVAASYLGGQHPPPVDPKLLDAATRDAIRSAHDQAATLAEAAGRQVGEARQILFLARGVDGDQATVMVAVRFGFADAK